MEVQTRTYDASEYLDDDETIALYLADAFEEGDPAQIALAIGNVAKARGMTAISQQTGLPREGLYKSLSAGGNPSMATILKVMKALGMQFDVKPAHIKEREPEPA